MCGRYASVRSSQALIDEFDIPADRADPPLPPDYNVAPTKTAPVVIARPPREDKDGDPVRQLRNLRWGLLPVYLSPSQAG